MKDDFPAISQMLEEPAILPSETISVMHQSKMEISDELQMFVGNPIQTQLDTIPTLVQNLPPITTNSIVGSNCLSESKLTSTESKTFDDTLPDDVLQLITNDEHAIVDSLSGNLQVPESSNLMIGNFPQSEDVSQGHIQFQNEEPFGQLKCGDLPSCNQVTPDQQEVTLIITNNPETSTNEQNACSIPFNHLQGLRPYLTEIQNNTLLRWVCENLTKNFGMVPVEENK